MDFHIINTNDKLVEGSYRTWLSHDYAFTNGPKERYGETLRSLNPGDLVFMYVSGKGIKAVGMVIKEWDGIEYRELIVPCPSSVINEYRIPVRWFIVIPDDFVPSPKVKEILGYPVTQTRARIEHNLGQTLLRYILQKLE